MKQTNTLTINRCNYISYNRTYKSLDQRIDPLHGTEAMRGPILTAVGLLLMACVAQGYFPEAHEQFEEKKISRPLTRQLPHHSAKSKYRVEKKPSEFDSNFKGQPNPKSVPKGTADRIKDPLPERPWHRQSPYKKNQPKNPQHLREKDTPLPTGSEPWNKESPKRNKFQNLVSSLIGKKGSPEIKPRQHKLEPETKEEPVNNKKRPVKQKQKRPVEAPIAKYRDPFDEYRDKKGVLVSIPLDILKHFFGGPHFHEQREPEEKNDEPRPHDKDERPPKTINSPRSITFDHSTDIDTEGRVNANFEDKGVKFAAGSYQDEVYSQWYVVTRNGYEFDGDPKELHTIFELANKQNLPSTSDVIPDSLLNAMNTMGAIQYKQSTVSPDSRERVSNTDQYPFSVVGHLDVGCTGTLIGPNHVLTAGHCVYEYDKEMWFNQLDFHRGKDCDPDEGDRYPWKLAITVKGWKDYGYPSYDYAIVVVSNPSAQWMTFGWSNSLHMADVQVVGYPSDKEEKCMWETSCNIGQEWNDLLGYKCDTSRGMSGGPVYR